VPEEEAPRAAPNAPDVNDFADSADPEYVARVWRQRAAALRARRGLDAAAQQEAADAGLRCLLVRAGADTVAIPLGYIVEVVEAGADLTFAEVPEAPPEFRGLAVLHGEVCPVFEAARLLPGGGAEGSDGGSDEDRPGHVVILRASAPRARDGSPAASLAGDNRDDVVGLLVDRAVDAVIGRESAGVGPAGAEDGRSAFLRGAVAVSANAVPIPLLHVPTLLAHLRSGDEATDRSDESEATEFADRDDPDPQEGTTRI
jgi:Chemotaxis signal transduction protein